ncbi:MAG: hypothetical protein HC882_00405 [Acidobacteria bacterium]|nr:hypothetical protein [Acidobacteriota bacterium]
MNVADKPEPETADVSIANVLMNHFMNDLREQKRTAMSQQPPDPFEQMKKAKEAMALLSGDGSGKSDPMVMMMVMMMQQMNQPRPEPKMDPMLVNLLDRMDRRMEAMEKRVSEERSAGPPPPPPPPPGPDVVEVISKLAPLLKPEIPRPEFTTMDIIRLMQESRKDDDRLGLKDVIQLIDRREGSGPQSLKEKFEEMMALREVASQISGGGGGGGEDNFWTALRSLFEHPALASGIGKALEKSAGVQRQQPTVVANQPASPKPAQVRAPAPVAQMPAQTVSSEPDPAEAPKIPATLRSRLEKLEKSLLVQDEMEANKARVLGTVECLTVLWQDPNWNKFVVELLTYVVQNNKEMSLKGLGGFLGFMHRNGLLANEAGKATFLTFRDNWENLQPELAKNLSPFLQMPSPAPSAAEAESEEEEGSEEGESEEEESEEEESEGASEESEESDEEESSAPPPAPAKAPSLFVTDIPQDGIEALYQQARRNAI